MEIAGRAGRLRVAPWTKHIPGIFNCDADDLSCLQVAAFHHRNPTTNQMPTPVAEEVWHI